MLANLVIMITNQSPEEFMKMYEIKEESTEHQAMIRRLKNNLGYFHVKDKA